jgi:hypothetical protein
MARDFSGLPLVPGVNADKLSVEAGMRQGASFGYAGAQDQMVIEYALMRHARGEEDGAERTALSHGIDLTSWYAIRAAAMAAAQSASR